MKIMAEGRLFLGEKVGQGEHMVSENGEFTSEWLC